MGGGKKNKKNGVPKPSLARCNYDNTTTVQFSSNVATFSLNSFTQKMYASLHPSDRALILPITLLHLLPPFLPLQIPQLHTKTRTPMTEKEKKKKKNELRTEMTSTVVPKSRDPITSLLGRRYPHVQAQAP
jgi:hypothetical protein